MKNLKIVPTAQIRAGTPITTVMAKLSKSSVSFAGRTRAQSSTHLTQRAADKSQRARLKVKLRVALAANANRWAALALESRYRETNL